MSTQRVYPPTVLSWLPQQIWNARNYDSSGTGAGGDVANNVEERHHTDVDLEHNFDLESLDGEVRMVGEMGLGFFRTLLVEHFDILFKQNKIIYITVYQI
jgi:hypothetical protein